MSTIYIINDLSQSQAWLHAWLISNRAALVRSGMELAPFPPWALTSIDHHCHLWTPQPKDKPFPPWLATQWSQMNDVLESGRNILFLSPVPWLTAHQFFYERLTAMLGRHEARALIIAGNPLISLEQRTRRSLVPIEANLAENHARLYLNWSELPPVATQHIGAANVRIHINPSQNIVSCASPEIAKAVLTFLNCAPLEPLAAIPLNTLFFQSHDARLLSQITDVRYDNWPPFEHDKYAATLGELDKSWGNCIATPWILRKKTHETFQKTQLEATEKLPPTPEDLLVERTVPVDTPLSPEQARSFALQLPHEITTALWHRFNTDAHLLSENQKIFHAVLCQPGTMGFTSLGEPEPPVKATVLTMTYNQERYIGECMDSVLMQQTDFPVRHIVLDHCSTDATPAIIADYARRHPSIQPVLLSQHVPQENVAGLFLRCRTKYAALCDGDDYFTEPYKLQKQIDFLEANPGYALSFHPVLVSYENGESPGIFPPPEILPRGLRESYYLSDLMRGNFIQTNSVVYRWRFQSGLPDWFRSDLCPADWYWHLLHAETGKISLDKEVMSVYRRHDDSLYKDSFKDSCKHRRQHGFDELETYKAVYNHFGESFFTPLGKLANGVFSDFMEVLLKENDSTLFDLACKKYPRFGHFFLESLKSLREHNQQARSGGLSNIH